MCAKRLEKGRFGWPAAESGQTKVVLSHEELALLLGGIDLAGSKRRAWFRRVVGAEPEIGRGEKNSFARKI